MATRPTATIDATCRHAFDCRWAGLWAEGIRVSKVGSWLAEEGDTVRPGTLLAEVQSDSGWIVRIGFEQACSSPAVIVVEGAFDVLTLRMWGYPAVALGGT